MDITSTSTELMAQASETAGLYLITAVKKINEALGKGAAKDHPELIAAFMASASSDFRTGLMAKTLIYAVDEITKGITQPKLE